MESLRDHRISIVTGFLAVVIAGTGLPAAAQEKLPPYDTSSTAAVYTTPEAAVVEATQQGRARDRGDAPARRSKRRCRLEPSAGLGEASDQLWAEHPGEALFRLSCDGELAGFVWRRIDPEPGRRGAPPREIAMHLRDEVPIPTVSLQANPGIGLVATESWFWIGGYSGEPITRSTDAFGRSIEVDARVERYEWIFGDGASLVTSSSGRPYPEPSEVRHIYERSSAGTGEGYLVQVRFVFSVQYRVAGGPPTELPGIARTASFRYPVQESQAVITR